MLGRSHALSGLTAGTAAGSLMLHLSPAPLALCAVLTAAYALAPDMDHRCATEARTFGFVTRSLAWTVGKLSGGHRHATHSLLGIAVFTFAAWLACYCRHAWPGRIALAVILAIGFAAALEALRIGGHHGNAVAVAGAVAMTWTRYGLALVPLAAALGTGAHIAGDMLTVQGCPLAWPLSRAHIRILPRPLAFTTGTWREHYVVAPLLLALLVWLAWRDAGTMVTHAHLTGVLFRRHS